MAEPFSLPRLPYAESALAPTISAQTIGFHYGKHHKTYVDTLNELVAGTEFADQSLEDIIKATAGNADKAQIFNNAGQVWNHNFYWHCLAPKGGGKPTGALEDKLSTNFGGFDKFKAQFSDAAKTVEGVGWALLLYDHWGDQLVLTQVEKQNLMHLAQMPILLGLDVFEHAYYLDYLNDRAKYVDAWWNVVNWSDVDSRLGKAK